jgi:hypothetical protein
MRRLARFLATPFGIAVLGCVVLAGWALWSAGILDGPMARQVRTSSVYTAPGVGLDRTAAERAIGNRRLVVLMLTPGTDLEGACNSVEHAAKGTLVLALSRKTDGFNAWGCADLPDVDQENFGKALVSETLISEGISGFADRPLDAIKVIAVNYDLLVKAGNVPDGARSITPSLPRYLVAAAAIAAVLLGAALLYAAGRRSGRLTAARRARRDAETDARSKLSAAAGVLAQQIIDLDEEYANDRRAFRTKYRKLVSDYTELLAPIAAADRGEGDPAELTERVEALNERCRRLAA